MSVIRLHRPVPTSDRLERLRLFPGRHLGEEEFDRMQAYTDARLAPLLATSHPGILHGLDVDLGALSTGAEGFTVRQGLAVAGNGRALGLFYPIRRSWQGLIDDYLETSGTTDSTGVFYLILRRSPGYIDADQGTDACQRTELDPRRDTRLVTVGTVGLRRLAISEQSLSDFTPEQIQNWVAADRVDGAFLKAMTNAVPLGLLAIQESVEEPGTYEVPWFSQASGRYLAVPDAGYLVLLKQVEEAFRRVMAEADNEVGGDATPTLADYLADNLRLDFLPAAGQLPLELLRNPDAQLPSLIWLPAHLGIDMVPVPEEAVSDLIERHVARRVVDLRQAAGDRLRLLLAVNEPDYRRDLLDFPQPDAVLEQDLYRYYMRAHESWRTWVRQYKHLYFHPEFVNLSEEQLKMLGIHDEVVRLGAEQLEVIAIPDMVEPPEHPEAHVKEMVSKAGEELTTPEEPETPYPYSEYSHAEPGQWRTPPPPFYTSWLQVPPGETEAEPPGVDDPEDYGLVIQHGLTQVAIERLENKSREVKKRLESTRDYLLVQRQQLDVQTVSLAALAGGVPGDGSGLQLSRWLPFTKFTPPPPVGSSDAEGVGERAPGLQPGSGSGARAPGLQPGSGSGARDPGGFQPGSGSGARAPLGTGTLWKSYRSPPLTPKGNYIAAGFNVSNVETELQMDRLNATAASSQPVTPEPAYDVAKEGKFGVIGRVLPDAREYVRAFKGLVDLREVVGDLFPDEAQNLKEKLDKTGKIKKPSNVSGTTERYQKLFEAGKILVKQIDIFEARQADLELKLRDLDRKLREAHNRLRQLGQDIITARNLLDGYNNRRIEQLGDYGVAQRLIDDDWRKVYEQNEERSRILTEELRGLYYVRVRPTPVTAALADPLELRHGTAGDIVPGCDWDEDAEVPEDLSEFFDAVLEVPMRDWRGLRPLRMHLPPMHRLDHIYELRRSRLSRRRSVPPKAVVHSALSARLQPLVLQNQSVLQQWSLQQLPTKGGSLKQFYRKSAWVLSLEDMLTGTGGRLRREAQRLRDRLEQCITCLLENLNAVPPSVRLQWAQLAEDDRLPVDQVERWPALERAERQEFNAARTVAELIEWWFRQLDSSASGTARSALRNMIRACLIVASLGDPTEILRGKVQVPPRRFSVGESLRIKLNRTAKPGTRLQLLDVSQRVVGLLSVEDHDETGTVANILRADRTALAIDTRFTVLSNRTTQRLLR